MMFGRAPIPMLAGTAALGPYNSLQFPAIHRGRRDLDWG